MCFNSETSIGAFTIGSLCSILLLWKKYYFYAIFSFSIVIMQLSEYFAHIAIETNNKWLNNLSSKTIYWILFLQPIVYSTFLQLIPPKNIKFKYPDLINIIYTPLVILYILVIGYYYSFLNKENLFYTNYLFKNCSSVCRLNWSFLNTKPFLMYLFAGIYFCIFQLFSFSDPSRSVSIANNYTTIVLLLSLIYIMIIGKGMKTKNLLTAFGSLWCFLCVFYGLILLFFLP